MKNHSYNQHIMSKLFSSFALLCIAIAVHGQSLAVFSGDQKVMGSNMEQIDSIVFYADNQGITPPPTKPSAPRVINAHWCALGTSITWWNENVDRSNGAFTAGYQSRVMNVIKFTEYTNQAVNGGTLESALDKVIPADYYTIEHGINDWGQGVDPGTFDDYLNDTRNGTFAATYRQLIDKIYSVNPDARIVLCTPRKGYGYKGFLPAHWYDLCKGHHLEDYADIVRQVARHEGIPLADFFDECGGQHNLHRLSIDVALHPNDPGYQLMANVLVEALKKIITEQ